MRILYLDNFRGFQDTFVNFKNVNFFVGENSTGKSSILKIIRALNRPYFLYELEFNTDEYQFGGFLDIFSKEPSDEKSIRIGYISYDEPKTDINNEDRKQEGKENSQDEVNWSCVLMEFKNLKNNPSLSGLSYVNGNYKIRIKISKNTFKYKYSRFDFHKNKSETLLNIMKSWVSLPINNDWGFSQEPLKSISYDLPISLFVRLYVEQLVQEDAKDISNSEENQTSSQIYVRPPFINWYNKEEFISPHYWFAPVRSKPLRIYDSLEKQYSPEGEHIPMLIKKILNSSRKTEFLNYVQDFGKQSGLFEDISIHKFSSSGMSPFELDIVFKQNNLRISDVGYGISQLLPILVELFRRPEESWFSIQQPEIHLHPRAQAAFGELIFKQATQENKNFIVETHSDFLIDRYRIALRESKLEKLPESSVFFFERDGLSNNITEISILNDGSYSKDQPDSFREFFINEELRNLGL